MLRKYFYAFSNLSNSTRHIINLTVMINGLLTILLQLYKVLYVLFSVCLFCLPRTRFELILKNSMTKYSKKQVALISGRSGKKVTSRKQAIAIGLSEARKAGAGVPKKMSTAARETTRKRHES